MFYLYRVHENGGGRKDFTQVKRVSLAGNTTGLIVQHLRRVLPRGQVEPWRWHISASDLFACMNPPTDANALVIDAKPGREETLIFRVLDIWGYSSNGWTPVLLRLGLVSEGGKRFNLTQFAQDRSEEVFTVLHMAGSVTGGKIVGTWNWPSVGATNSTFLWPEVLDYFAERMRYTRVRLEQPAQR